MMMIALNFTVFMVLLFTIPYQIVKSVFYNDMLQYNSLKYDLNLTSKYVILLKKDVVFRIDNVEKVTNNDSYSLYYLLSAVHMYKLPDHNFIHDLIKTRHV